MCNIVFGASASEDALVGTFVVVSAASAPGIEQRFQRCHREVGLRIPEAGEQFIPVRREATST
jgi:hypothetical protein